MKISCKTIKIYDFKTYYAFNLIGITYINTHQVRCLNIILFNLLVSLTKEKNKLTE